MKPPGIAEVTLGGIGTSSGDGAWLLAIQPLLIPA
jgi:hypothetical protein